MKFNSKHVKTIEHALAKAAPALNWDANKHAQHESVINELVALLRDTPKFDEYNFRGNAGQTRVVKNMMSKEQVRIRFNTPLFCDPSSEAYWSM